MEARHAPTGAHAVASGTFAIVDHGPRLDLSGSWTDFRWPLAGREAADRAGVPALLAAQDETFSGQVRRRRDEDRRPQVRAALDSATVEGIAQPGEQALLPRRELAGRRFLAAQLG